MKQLIKNELIKLRAQKTYLVLSCVVLALVVVVSFFTSVLMTPLNNLIIYREDVLIESAAYDWAINQIEKNPDGALAKILRAVFKDPKSDADKSRQEAQEYLENGHLGMYAEAMAYAEMHDFFDRNQVPEWVTGTVTYPLVTAYKWRSIVKGWADGTYTTKDMVEDYALSEVLYMNYRGYGDQYVEPEYYYQVYVTEWDETKYEPKAYVFVRVSNETYTEVECTWTEVLGDLCDHLEECESYIAELETYATTIEPDAYYDAIIAQYRQEIEANKNGIENYQEEIKQLEPEQGEEMRAWYEAQIADCRGKIEDAEYVIAAYEDLKELDAHPESSAFALVNVVLPNVLRTRRDAISSIAMNEATDTFVLIAKASESSAKHKIRICDKALVAIEYAYTRDILPVSMGASSAKATFLNNLSTASFLISAVVVVLASMILSREFATGTVRLWVIRPRTRSKLLGSKIAALLIYVCTMMGASFVITYAFALVNHLIDLFFYGQSSLFANDYGVVFGNVIPIPAVLEHLWALILFTLPVLLYAALCLFISVLTKKGVLGIVAGMLVLMFATDIQAFALIVSNYTGAFGYLLHATVLPYLGMDRLLVTALDFGTLSGMMGSMDGLGALMGLEDMLMSQIWGVAPYVCSTLVGAVVLSVHIVGLVLLSLFVFKRTQIKS
ncbi:MAG: ABC transporter permease subunit [Clostridia bacterium]|nr:ABC transporter permease subunit [Clostridia bacterium]